MDYSCAENFTSTNDCQGWLDSTRESSAGQVEALLQYSVLLSIETGLYTLSVALFAASTYILWSKGILLKPNLAMWLATLVMFVGSTAHYSVYWVYMLNNNAYQQYVVDNDWSFFYGNNSDLEYPPPDGRNLSPVLQYLPIVNYLLSDVIVFWRAWMLWNRSRWIAILAGILVTGTTVSAIVSAQTTRMEGIFVTDHPLGFDGDPIYNEMVDSQWAVWAMSLGSNILATGLIGFKAYQHRAFIEAHLKGVNRRMKTEAVLVLLIESAVLYCGVWILYIVSQLSVNELEIDIPSSSTRLPSGKIMFNKVMPTVLAQMAGLYPTAVIVLVTLQKTTWDMTRAVQGPHNPLTMDLAMRGVTVPSRSPASSQNFGMENSSRSGQHAVIQIGFERSVTIDEPTNETGKSNEGKGRRSPTGLHDPVDIDVGAGKGYDEDSVGADMV